MIANHAGAATGKQLDLQLTAPAAVSVRGYPQLLTMLLDNLVQNAIRHSEQPAPVAIVIGRVGDAVSIAIIDRGIGIAGDRMPHLFERFFRADADRSRAAAGSGLGLSIVRAIAERHGVACRVQRELGVGTRVEVEFSAERVRMG